MGLSFRYTASAFCYSIVQDLDHVSSEFVSNDVVRFVLKQHRNMPDFFRLPIIVLTLIFDFWGILKAGMPFHRLPPDTRRLQIQSWKQSPIAPFRDLVRFYESLSIYGLYAAAEEAKAQSLC